MVVDVARFFDTSALVRRYLTDEPGASAVEVACREDVPIYVSRLLVTEVASALAAGVRMGAVSASQRDRLWQLFAAHAHGQYRVAALNEPIHQRSEVLLFRHPLKAGDALHIATAEDLQLGSPSTRLEFWTADQQQARAAAAEHLAVRLVS